MQLPECKAKGSELDYLLRYEASLERNFDRTLGQLERLQRMRLGHPVLAHTRSAPFGVLKNEGKGKGWRPA